MPATFFVLAGEASGDLHGAKLLEALKRLEPAARFVGMGGPKMAAAGLEVAKDLDGMQVVGFWEVLKRLGFFRQVFHKLLDRVKQERPSALICIDYPGFNLRFAKEVRKLGIPCLYYIVPQVWAWKPKRAAKMAEFIDRAFCVFEFEPPFFDRFRSAERKMKTQFVGHPLLDQPPPPKLEIPPDRQNVGLLAGSRANEFYCLWRALSSGFFIANQKSKNLRALMSIPSGANRLDYCDARWNLMHGRTGTIISDGPQYLKTKQIVVGPESEHERCRIFIENSPPKRHFIPEAGLDVDESIENILPESNQKEELIEASHAILLPSISAFSVVKSGTSTLEAGLQGNPMCVVYKGGAISYALARLLVDIPVVSLVNIVLGRYAVPELLQSEVNPARIAAEIERGLTDQKYIEAQRAALAELPMKLGGPGASERAARGMLDFLKGRE